MCRTQNATRRCSCAGNARLAGASRFSAIRACCSVLLIQENLWWTFPLSNRWRSSFLAASVQRGRRIRCCRYSPLEAMRFRKCSHPAWQYSPSRQETTTGYEGQSQLGSSTGFHHRLHLLWPFGSGLLQEYSKESQAIALR